MLSCNLWSQLGRRGALLPQSSCNCVISAFLMYGMALLFILCFYALIRSTVLCLCHLVLVVVIKQGQVSCAFDDHCPPLSFLFIHLWPAAFAWLRLTLPNKSMFLTTFKNMAWAPTMLDRDHKDLCRTTLLLSHTNTLLMLTLCCQGCVFPWNGSTFELVPQVYQWVKSMAFCKHFAYI